MYFWDFMVEFFFEGSVVFGLQEELADRFVVVLFSFLS